MNSYINKKKKSEKRCKAFRNKILDISQKVSALHLGGSFSCLEIIDLIYFEFLNRKKDTFLMSKGHSCIAQYVILEKLKILKSKDLNQYCKNNGILGCHPDYGNPGINASTGSLGHGVALAVGIAHYYKINKSNARVFCIISDGELQEGSTWEAMMMAANLNLNNLILFLDHNGSQSFGKTKETHPKFYPIQSKVTSFNWSVCNIKNGHDQIEILKKVNKEIKNISKPTLFICNTVKGKGVSYMEHQPIWHYRSPNKTEYIQAKREINAK